MYVAHLKIHERIFLLKCSANLADNWTTVKVGFAYPADAKVELPAIKRFSTSCTIRFLSTTELEESKPILVPPI